MLMGQDEGTKSKIKLYCSRYSNRQMTTRRFSNGFHNEVLLPLWYCAVSPAKLSGAVPRVWCNVQHP